MQPPEQFLAPNRSGFEADPFGYSALAWMRWAVAQNIAGLDVDPEKPPTAVDLKSPVLWLTQAHALSEAAVKVVRSEPDLEHMPLLLKGVCHSQYFAVALMLIGYSLEICLKGMIIVRKGIEAYIADEKEHRHHNLVVLADFVPDLTDKDQAILKLLTHFLVWAGRYPDPGSGRESQAEELFSLSERYQISASDLFATSARVMGHVKQLVE